MNDLYFWLFINKQYERFYKYYRVVFKIKFFKILYICYFKKLFYFLLFDKVCDVLKIEVRLSV